MCVSWCVVELYSCCPPRIIFSADGCRHGNFPMLSTASPETTIYLINWDKKSMGNGKMMVEFFSAEMVLNVCSVFRHSIWKSSIKSEIYINKEKRRKLWRTWRYRNCRAAGDWAITMEASLRAVDALNSPSAAMTLARASRDASASAAMARWSWTGKRTSFLFSYHSTTQYSSIDEI